MGKYIYTYIENGQMYDKSPSLAELLAKEGLSCEKIVTGRIEYIKIKDFETQIKDAQWLVFTSKNAVAGFAYNAGNVCSLNNISVTSSADSANLYSETYCSSFKCK